MPETFSSPQPSSSRAPAAACGRLVVCLCAEWCGACREYRTVFGQVARVQPSGHFVWLDIEEHADWLGELEVETFPTLLVADGEAIRFAGPVPPHADTLTRLLESLARTGSAPPPDNADWLALVQTLRRQAR